MNKNVLIKDVKKLNSDLKYNIQYIIDECPLAYQKDLDRYIDKIDERFIIANIDSNQDVLAIACLEKQNKDLYLDILYVSKYARRKGHGEKMLSVVTKFAKENGFDELNLVVKKENTPAISLYKKKHFILHHADGEVLSLNRTLSPNANLVGGILFELKKKNPAFVNEGDIEYDERYEKYCFKKEGKEELIKKILSEKLFATAYALLRTSESGVLDKDALLKIKRYAGEKEDLFGDEAFVKGIDIVKDVDKSTLKKAFQALSVYEDLTYEENYMKKEQDKEIKSYDEDIKIKG